MRTALLGLHILSLAAVGATDVRCDWGEAKRRLVQREALASLQLDGFGVEAKGVLAYMVPESEEQVVGNPNTTYGLVLFPGSKRKGLLPRGYPEPPLPSQASGSPFGPRTAGGQWFAMQRDEAIVVMFCTPPPARYFGVSTYVTSRLLYNTTETGDGDASLVSHFATAELHDPFNRMRMGTTAGPAPLPSSSFSGSTAVLVWAPSKAVYRHIAKAYISAGLPPEAINFYGISGQVARLHDRSQGSWRYDYPDLFTIVSRVSYFDDRDLGSAWVNQTWPAVFLRAPSHASPHYRVSVPEQQLRSDIANDSEARLVPVLDKLMDAIEADKASRATLLRKDQLTAVTNGREMRDSCLNDYDYVPVKSPFKSSGCGFGTRDCRYGAGVFGMEFGQDRFFVVVGVRHEALKHSSYSSVMFTSEAHIEEMAHTITVREKDGTGVPQLYLPDEADADLLYAVTLARSCPEGLAGCVAFSESQFGEDDVVYWLERAYLNPATGVGPNIDEYVMSYVMAFQGSP